MRRFCLRVKVFIVHVLIRAGLRENVWHKCEIDLAKIEAERLFGAIFGKDPFDGE